MTTKLQGPSTDGVRLFLDDTISCFTRFDFLTNIHHIQDTFCKKRTTKDHILTNLTIGASEATIAEQLLKNYY